MCRIADQHHATTTPALLLDPLDGRTVNVGVRLERAEVLLHDVAEAREALPQPSEATLYGIAEAGPGIVLEDKGYSLALHYRLAPEKERLVREAAAKICDELKAAAIELLPGKLVVEIKQTGFTKATAVRELMTYAPFADRRPIFIGDDETDLGVFEIMPDFDGIGISVGRNVPGVKSCFERPTDVRHWLEQISRTDALATS